MKEGNDLAKERLLEIGIVESREKRRDGSAKLLVLLFVVAAAAGLGYWILMLMPQQAKRNYHEETERIGLELSLAVRQQTEWTTAENLDRFSAEIREFESREGADPALASRLHELLDEIRETRRLRDQRFAALREEAKTFPMDGGNDAIEAFDERVRLATGQFEREQTSLLKREWSIRRSEILKFVNANSGELTIRTAPSKAKIFMDGKELAVSPVKIGRVAPGRHELLITKEGYRDKSVSFTMDSSGEVDLGIQTLDAISGSVKISVTGGGRKDKIEVEIEEIDASQNAGGVEFLSGYFFLEGREHHLETIKTGAYSLIVTRNGKQVSKELLLVEEGKTHDVTIEL